MEEWLIAPISALISILVAIYLYHYVKKQESGTKKMQEISGAIQEGANAFLKREYKTLAIFVVIVAIVLGVFLPKPIWTTANAVNNLSLALAYMFGSACSASAGLFGMDVALKGNVRTTNAAKRGIDKAFPIAFRGGATMGLASVGLAVLGISIVYGIGVMRALDTVTNLTIVLGFSFGASAMALFAKAGGGIYTKTADIGADLVGKVELGIPEDDPRNPAVVADNVGDNVGDVAGMGADMIDSYIAALVASMILGAALGTKEMYLPLIFSGLGIIASIIGVASVRVGKKGDPGKALNRGTYITCVTLAVLTLLVTKYLGFDLRIWLATVAGLVAGVVIGITSDYFTSINRPPVRKTAEVSNTGTAINLITGFSYGLESVVPPLFGIGITTAVAYFLCQSIGNTDVMALKYGVYGIGIAAFGMLSVVGSILANDAYGPIGDNAKGIAEQSGEMEKVVDVLDKLDAAGNTTKAISKGFAIGAAGLTVIALLAAYREIIESAGGTIEFGLMNPLVLLGIFIGIAMPPLFSAMVMLGVGKNSSRMIKEIRRQFREIPGLKEGKEGARPDYAACVDIATKGALKELMLPSILSIAVTLIVGFACGIEALGGYLAGSIFSGLVFALLMANSGGLWDNAKKYIEAGAFGGEGSEAHKAAVVGDTVGDPFKDTAGPSLNTQICVMGLVANLFAPLIVLLWLA
jgi:K(+)-stimulated pyrophosphate-energized sodium pump